MTRHARAVTWRVSGHDLQEHAFYAISAGPDMSEALCTHSVPSDRLVAPEDAPPGGRRCVACLLIHGGDLAEQHEAPKWQA